MIRAVVAAKMPLTISRKNIFALTYMKARHLAERKSSVMTKGSDEGSHPAKYGERRYGHRREEKGGAGPRVGAETRHIQLLRR